MSHSLLIVPDMRDGPHCSLPLSRDWKRVAERLDDTNYGVAQVCDALCLAIQQDWQSKGVPRFLQSLLQILRPLQLDMLCPTTLLDELRPEADGHGTRSELLELAHGLAEAPWSQAKWIGMVHQALFGELHRRKTQIIVHYRCRAPDRVGNIEIRLDVVGQEMEPALQELAKKVASGTREPLTVPRREGLDEGVPAGDCS